MPDEPRKFQIEAPLLQDIVNYLASQRYMDVFQLIGRIQQLSKIEPKENSTTSEKE